MNEKKIPELLSPCGTREALRAAIFAGADAVYFGGHVFNARMNAENFDDEELRRAVEECHKNGVKAYITLNTQIYDRELEAALGYADFLYRAGADALITADPGLSRLIKEYVPGLELHASTQASGHSVDCARALADLGFSRMVCARELSLPDLLTLTEGSPIEIEMFIHGSMCVSHSGQCLMSSVIGGRSGNRGECAQPCRMKYNGTYPLSLKDMCLASHIPQIIGSGVASVKIEGRMKSPAYVYEVTRLYRRLLDERRAAAAGEIKRLEEVFSREGFTDGYFTGKNDRSMLGIRTEKNKQEARGLKTEIKKTERGLPEIKKEITETCLPSHAYFRTAPHRSGKCLSLRFETPSQIPQDCRADIIYLPLERFAPPADGIVLPAAVFDSEREEIRNKILDAEKLGAGHALIQNIGQLPLLEGTGLTAHGDFRLNVFNGRDFEALGALRDVTVSAELRLPQIRDLPEKKAVMIYGRLPLMLLQRECGSKFLRDRTGAAFPVIKEGKREIVLNSVPLYMADRKEELEKNGIFNVRLCFTTESREECAKIIAAYEKGLPPAGNVKRIKE